MNIQLNYSKIALQLSHMCVIKVSGCDAISFLNDQFTNDITALETNRWQFNGYCSSKGRLIAIMRLFVNDDCVYILVPESLCETLIKRLQIYVFRAKVKFEILDGHSVYCLMGTDSINDLGEIQTQQFKTDENGFIVNISNHSNRYLAIVNSEDALAGLEIIPSEESQKLWRLSEINEMVANIDAQTSELFIPQHVHLDKLGGISFNKGCFPGQEVVARLHYLGKAKQTMRHIKIDSSTEIVPGQTLNHADYKKALKIVDAVRTDNQTYECLAVGQFDQ